MCIHKKLLLSNRGKWIFIFLFFIFFEEMAKLKLLCHNLNVGRTTKTANDIVHKSKHKRDQEHGGGSIQSILSRGIASAVRLHDPKSVSRSSSLSRHSLVGS
jgi:hypothetical protein